MAFKIRDLMINDLSGQPNQIDFHTKCTAVTQSPDCFNSILATPIYDIGDPAEFLASLATLKEQLRRQLAGVEKLEAALEKRLLPESVEEIDALSDKLTGALEDLRALKAQKLAGD